MTLFQIFLVALIQGVTEFLPVSSSGHLILLPSLTGFADQGQAIDVAVHVGTLGAVMLYFRAEVGAALAGDVAIEEVRIWKTKTAGGTLFSPTHLGRVLFRPP